MKAVYSQQTHDQLIAQWQRARDEYFAFAESFNGRKFTDLPYADQAKVERLWKAMDGADLAATKYRQRFGDSLKNF
jgi:hypothetical protein